jgi:hypothetical protein
MLKPAKTFLIFFFLALALIILLISARQINRVFFNSYLPDFNQQIQNDVTTLKFSVPQDEIACASLSGVWKKLGTRPFEECNLPTTDGGKICRASEECEGVCLAELSEEQKKEGLNGRKFKTLGKCSSWIKVLGCQVYVYQGWAQVVCVD